MSARDFFVQKRLLDFFSSFISFNNILDSFIRVEKIADRTIVIQCINDESDVFTHITVDIVWFAQKFRCLAD